MKTETGKALDETLAVMKLTQAEFVRYLGEKPHYAATLSRLGNTPRVPLAQTVHTIATKLEADPRPEVAACGPALRKAQAADAARKGREIGQRMAELPARASGASRPVVDLPPAQRALVDELFDLVEEHPWVAQRLIAKAGRMIRDDAADEAADGGGAT